ncbi:MAG: translocation/assembly module TamB, partial [Bacteroides sp.]|nr:translocation/assembly module TamB [Bacteroides sp.]
MITICYIGILILLNIPSVQRKMASFASRELEKILETELQIGRIHIGFLNRIIIDDLLVNDQQNTEMLRITRLSAKFDLLPLLNGKVSISNLQLFSFNVALNRAEKESDLNLQFIIDAFKSDKPATESSLDLRINSILIRRGRLSFNVLSEPETPEKFNTNHLRFTNIIGNLSIKALHKDSINTQVKRFSFNEESGLDLQKLSFRAVGNRQGLSVENFSVALPETELKMDTIRLKFNNPGSFLNFSEEVSFSLRIAPSDIVLKDVAPFVPVLNNFDETIRFSMELNGTLNDLDCPYVTVDVGDHIRFKMNASIQNLVNPEEAFIFGNVSRLFIDPTGSNFIFRNINPQKPTSPYIERMGT